MGDLQTTAVLRRLLVSAAGVTAVAAVQLFGIFSGCLSVRADEPPANEVDIPAVPEGTLDAAKLAERVQLWKEAQRLQAIDKLPDAIEAVEEALAIERELLGDEHPQVDRTWNVLHELYRSLERFDEAHDAAKHRLAIRQKVYGKEDWRVTDARLVLADIATLRRLTPTERAELLRADRLQSQVRQLEEAGQYKEAIEPAQQALEIRKRLLGEMNRQVATSLDDLARMYQESGDYAQALALNTQALEVEKKILGEDHPGYATALSNLANNYYSTGQYAKAEPLYQQALDIRKHALGETDDSYLIYLNNLGHLYVAMGKHELAERLFRQALEIRARTVGKEHAMYAAALFGLASSMRDLRRSEPLLREAAEILKNTLGKDHPHYASCLTNLAGVYHSLGEYEQAATVLREAVEIYKRTLGEQHPYYSTALLNLARNYIALEDYAQAEPLLLQVVETDKSALGEQHPDYASSLNGVGVLYSEMRQHRWAIPWFEQALELQAEVLGKSHHDYALSLHNLAWQYQELGEFARAEPLAREAIAIVRQNLDVAASEQSERQQLALVASLAYRLASYVQLSLRAADFTESAAQAIVDWKGSVLRRQRTMRLARDDAALAPLFDQFERISAELAGIALQTPAPEQQAAWQERVAKLTEQREELDADLSARSSVYREGQRQVMLAEIQAALGRDAALIDTLEIAWGEDNPAEKTKRKDRKSATPKTHLAAFVLRDQRPVVAVDLGPTEAITALIDRWRAGLTRPDPVASEETDDVARQLRARLWEPLEKHLRGVRTVLVSPDGPLTRVPLAALPGKAEGTVLLHDYALGVVPVPQLLSELASKARDRTAAGADGPSLLTIGDIDYGGDPGSVLLAGRPVADLPRAAIGNVSAPWVALPGTKRELAATARQFAKKFPRGKVSQIFGADATEQRLRTESPRFSILHVATHGFFATPDSSTMHDSERTPALGASELGGHTEAIEVSPDLQSGLVLAGANRGRDAEGEATTAEAVDRISDDGILTALEIAGLDLRRMDLAVLSACETGLGATAGGEGVLGLQRAFQVAGARTTITSLWKVDDDATRALMTEFYQNLWQRKLGKLEALRQAQLKMLTNYDIKEHTLRGAVRPRDEGRPAPAPGATKSRIPPYYWAAFVVAGDWR